jgi:prepilin-type N-terminal cleavage/methylation domain-containing protein
MKTASARAFTLIELLIVVAIIAILAAIAVPNFLEAQTRSKVSRVKSDHRVFATALEAYAVDNNHYPPSDDDPAVYAPRHNANHTLRPLSTPIAYLTALPAVDPLVGNGRITTTRDEVDLTNTYLYFNYMDWYLEAGLGASPVAGYMMTSVGPDKNAEFIEHIIRAEHLINDVYDPTNGTMSSGDFGRMGGGARAIVSLPQVIGGGN